MIGFKAAELTVRVDCAPSVPWKADEPVTGSAGLTSRGIRSGPRGKRSEVRLGASRRKAVEGLLFLITARSSLKDSDRLYFKSMR